MRKKVVPLAVAAEIMVDAERVIGWTDNNHPDDATAKAKTITSKQEMVTVRNVRDFPPKFDIYGSINDNLINNKRFYTNLCAYTI